MLDMLATVPPASGEKVTALAGWNQMEDNVRSEPGCRIPAVREPLASGGLLDLRSHHSTSTWVPGAIATTGMLWTNLTFLICPLTIASNS